MRVSIQEKINEMRPGELYFDTISKEDDEGKIYYLYLGKCEGGNKNLYNFLTKNNIIVSRTDLYIWTYFKLVQ